MVKPSATEHTVALDEDLVQDVVQRRDVHAWNRVPAEPVLWRPEAEGVFCLVFPTQEDLDEFLSWTAYAAFVGRAEPELTGVCFDTFVEEVRDAVG